MTLYDPFFPTPKGLRAKRSTGASPVSGLNTGLTASLTPTPVGNPDTLAILAARRGEGGTTPDTAQSGTQAFIDRMKAQERQREKEREEQRRQREKHQTDQRRAQERRDRAAAGTRANR